MKNIELKNKNIKISDEVVAGAYCGSYCASHIAYMGQATEDYSADFKFLFNYHYVRILKMVRSQVDKMSIWQFLDESPSNLWGIIKEESFV